LGFRQGYDNLKVCFFHFDQCQSIVIQPNDSRQTNGLFFLKEAASNFRINSTRTNSTILNQNKKAPQASVNKPIRLPSKASSVVYTNTKMQGKQSGNAGNETQKMNGKKTGGMGKEQSPVPSSLPTQTITPILSAASSSIQRMEEREVGFSQELLAKKGPAGFVPVQEYNSVKKQLDETRAKLEEAEYVNQSGILIPHSTGAQSKREKNEGV
jgi:hypothetical protein